MSDYRMRDAGKDTAFGIGTAIMVGVAVIVVVIVVGLVGVFGFGWFSNSTANFRGNVAKKNLVEANGNYRIAAYDHFFDLCAGVQSDEASIKNLQDELQGSPAPDAQRITVIQASITALKNARATAINQYNVDAAKSYTEGQFRSSHLSFKLDLNAQETTCTA
jgi:hypothetical protein